MDASEVAPGLWIASSFYPWDEADEARFSRGPLAVFDLADTAIVRPGPERMVISYPIEDGPAKPDIDDLIPFAAQLRGDGWAIMGLCNAGRNRSAVLIAAILVGEDWDPHEAIAAVQAARRPALERTGGALTNETFRAWLGASA